MNLIYGKVILMAKRTLKERVEDAQKMIENQALAFGQVVIDNLDKKDFESVKDFKKWYEGAIREERSSHQTKQNYL